MRTVDLTSLSRERLLAALAAPGNQHPDAQDVIRRALGAKGVDTPPVGGEGVQGATEGAGDVLTLVLPLPYRALSPNARVHWRKRASAVRLYRNTAMAEAYWLCRDSGIAQPAWEAATAQATFYYQQRRRRDADNLLAMLKPAFDGLADARVIANDSGLTHLPVRIEVDRERPRLELTIVACGR